MCLCVCMYLSKCLRVCALVCAYACDCMNVRVREFLSVCL